MSDPSSISRPPLQRGTGTEEPFTLSPHIFLPFSSFPLTPKNARQEPLTQTQHLKNIISNLEKQQNLVRGSMLHALKTRSNELSALARKEIGTGDEAEEFEFDEAEQRRKEKSVAEMFEKVKKVAKKGAKSEDFEFDFRKGEQVEMDSFSSPKGGNGDVNLAKRRGGEVLRGLRSRELKDLVEFGVKELGEYDLRCQKVVGHYRGALERRERGGGAGVWFDAKMGEVRRMSTGMPVPGLLVERDRNRELVRSLESIEELARRGSK